MPRAEECKTFPVVLNFPSVRHDVVFHKEAGNRLHFLVPAGPRGGTFVICSRSIPILDAFYVEKTACFFCAPVPEPRRKIEGTRKSSLA